MRDIEGIDPRHRRAALAFVAAALPATFLLIATTAGILAIVPHTAGAIGVLEHLDLVQVAMIFGAGWVFGASLLIRSVFDLIRASSSSVSSRDVL